MRFAPETRPEWPLAGTRTKRDAFAMLLGRHRMVRIDSWSMLESLRARAGLTQAELAAVIGSSRKTISSLERGLSVPSLTTARALARALDVSIDDLFPDDELR